MPTDTETARIIISAVTKVDTKPDWLMRYDTINPTAVPIIPPTKVSKAASIRN